MYPTPSRPSGPNGQTGPFNVVQPPYSCPPTYEEALSGTRVSGVNYPPVSGFSTPAASDENASKFWSPPYPTQSITDQHRFATMERTTTVYPGIQNSCGGTQPSACCQHNTIPSRQQFPQQYPIVVPIQTPDPSIHRAPACVRCCIATIVIIFFAFFFLITFKMIHH